MAISLPPQVPVATLNRYLREQMEAPDGMSKMMERLMANGRIQYSSADDVLRHNEAWERRYRKWATRGSIVEQAERILAEAAELL